MSFDLAIWKQAAADKLRDIGGWLDRRKTQDAPYLMYGTLCGLSLWPLVDAMQRGEILPVMMALGSVAGGVGGNLIAEQVQRWKDSAEPVDEAQVSHWAAQNADNAEVRAALDAIVERLEAVSLAQAGLSQADQQWFADTLKRELTQLGNLPRYETMLIGSGAIAQGAGAKAAGERGVVADTIYGSVVTGDRNRVVQAETYIERQEVHTPPDLVERARAHYLKRLRQRCNVLPLAALGGEEETGEEVSLERVYVALDTQTPVSTPQEDEAKRQGIVLPERTERRLSALEVATQAKRLVLLGDPGSGKSAFVRQLTSRLAAACLGEREPFDGWDACLVPMLVTLRELAPRLARLTLDKISDRERDDRLVEAVRHQWQADLRELGAAGLDTELDKVLTDGTVVLVFDGLDEVAESLRTRVRQAVRAVLREYPTIQRVIVTSRIRSYVGPAVLRNFTVHTMAPFDENKIRQFVEAWYRAQLALGRISQEHADKNIQDLQQAALSRDLREMSSNPLLLTTMAIIHQREVGLSKERVRLYSLAVQVLLSRWQKRKGIAVSEALGKVLGNDLTMRAILERLGYAAHQLQSEQGPKADLARRDILALLEESQYLGDVGLAAEFLDYCDQHAGLLVGRGGDEEGLKPQTYSFPHRTFQEYLAGCYMIAGRGVEREYWKRAGQGDYWYLAAQLGVEELLYNRRSNQVLLDLAYDLCPGETPDQEAAWRAALWSGQIATLLGQDAIKQDDKPGGGQIYLDRLLPRLVQIVESNHLGAIEREEAGRVLGKLSDPRAQVMTLERMEFCFVSAGPFVMGSDSDPMASSDEMPLHWTSLDSYWIARYPVAIAQFADFVQAGGYQQPRYWQEARAVGVWQAGQVKAWNDDVPRVEPFDFGEPFNLPNHPVVGVTWYEALAYVRWLTEEWHRQGLLPDQWQVRLPSEAEWEKAARGGVQVSTLICQISNINWQEQVEISTTENPEPQRRYPWGNDPNPNRANYSRASINTTSAMGCFSDGVSPYGCEELSGNVWEWCATKWQGSYRSYRDDNDPSGRELRVLRGGSFSDNENCIRCAIRCFMYNPYSQRRYIGFRIMLSPL